MNKVILIGRLTKDVELRYTQTNNTAVASFSLAVNRKFVKPGEERQADFFNIIAWNKLAENISKYLFKGNQVAISGRLETRSWDDQNGQKHYVTEVIAEEVDFIESNSLFALHTIHIRQNRYSHVHPGHLLQAEIADTELI